MLLSEEQMSDFKGDALMIEAMPDAKVLLGDRGYDANWFRNALIASGIEPCIPSKANRKTQIPHDRSLYRKRRHISISKLASGLFLTGLPGRTERYYATCGGLQLSLHISPTPQASRRSRGLPGGGGCRCKRGRY